MAVEPTTPVTAVQGIGPATAEALASIGVHTVFDLGRVTVDRLHAAAQALASVAEVGSWRQMATFCHLSEMTAQWAEALVIHDIESIDELARTPFGEIDLLMRDALEQGTIPTAPSADQIAEMMKDAVLLGHTGSIMGTVRDTNGQPVRDAAASVGAAEAVSDERGRFRILRIPLGSPLPLQITHPEFQALIIEGPRVTRDIDAADVQLFELGDSSSAEPVSLSELAGDVLPMGHGVPVRQRQVELSELQPGDILVARRFYESAPDVELVSLFKIYEAGEILVRTVRAPVAALPGQASLWDQFMYSGNDFERVQMSAIDVYRYKIRRRMENIFAEQPEPTTPEEKLAAAEERMAFLIEQGYFAIAGGEHGV